MGRPSFCRSGAVAFLLLGFSLAACQQPSSDYVDQVTAAPIPQDPAVRRAACNDVRMDIADQQSREQIAQSGALSPVLAMAATRQFDTRIAALENRAAALQRSCDVQKDACARAANAKTIQASVADCETVRARAKRGNLSRSGLVRWTRLTCTPAGV